MSEPITPEQSPPSFQQENKKRGLKIILLLLVLLVLGGVLVAFKANKSPSNKQSKTIGIPAQVKVTASGFGPATLQIKAGTQVIWTNNDTKPHQVAADPYPKDNSIPNFNSTIVLQKQDTYAYTFTKSGTYTYHDERNPLQFKGTVIVQ